MGEKGKRSRRARASAVTAAVAVAAPILFVGGALARAAESSPGAPTSVSVTETDANGQPVGNTGDPAATNSSAGNGNGGNTGSPAASVAQTISVSILPGPLTVTPSTESISFTNTGGQGNGAHLTGSLSAVKVVDARGSLVGWQATVSLQSVSGVSASALANARLCVNPGAPTVVAGNPPEVRSGRHACGNAGDALTLFYAPPNGGGGTFTDAGSLTLDLPGGVGAGPVTATLAVAVH